MTGCAGAHGAVSMVWQKPEHNTAVELLPEEEGARRGVFEIMQTHDVRWIQCPRCRRRFWYALVEDTPQAERWEWGKRLRAKLLGRPCAEHPSAPT